MKIKNVVAVVLLLISSSMTLAQEPKIEKNKDPMTPTAGTSCANRTREQSMDVPEDWRQRQCTAAETSNRWHRGGTMLTANSKTKVTAKNCAIVFFCLIMLASLWQQTAAQVTLERPRDTGLKKNESPKVQKLPDLVVTNIQYSATKPRSLSTIRGSRHRRRAS
jgi:hypothetical protein